MKTFIGLIAIALVCYGYGVYIRNILRGVTKPHVYSWFVWGFVTAIAFGLQESSRAGIGGIVTLAGATFSFIVFGLGLHSKDKDITKSDTIFFIIALLAIGIWVFAKQPIISAILVSGIDAISFAPTIRKSWSKPNTETARLYGVSALRFGLALIALEHYSIVTIMFPLTNMVTDAGFCVMLIIRRWQLSRNAAYRPATMTE